MGFFKLAAACGLAIAAAASGAAAQTPPPDLVFTAITPCRAFVTSPALAANQARSFVVSGTSAAFTAQGGPSAGCGVPASAAAVAISLTSFGSTGAGHLRSTAFGEPITGTQVLSFRTGVTETAGVITGVKSGKLTVKSYAAATRLAGDITGYYAPHMQAHIDSDGSVIKKTSRIISSLRISQGSYQVKIDRNVDNCYVFTSSTFASYTTSAVTVQDIVYVNVIDPLYNRYYNWAFYLNVGC